jgi:hypothetical protein
MKLTQMMKKKVTKKKVPVQAMVPEKLHDAVQKQLDIDELTWTTLIVSSLKLYLAEKDQSIPEE